MGAFSNSWYKINAELSHFCQQKAKKKKNHRSVKEFTEATCLITCFRSDF